MNRKIDSVTVGTGLTALIVIVIVILVSPFISFGVCYIAGLIAKATIGNFLVDGFALFNLNIPLDKIPLAAGILGWVASFFKEVRMNKSSD